MLLNVGFVNEIQVINMIISLQNATEKAIEKTQESLSALGYRIEEIHIKGIKQWNCLELESDYVSAQILMTKKRNGSISIEVKFDINSKHYRLRGRVFDEVASKLRGVITEKKWTRTGWITILGSDFYLN